MLLQVMALAPSSAARQRARVLGLDAAPPVVERLASVPVAVRVAAQVAQLVSPLRLALPSLVADVVRLAVCGLLVSSPALSPRPEATLSLELAS